MRKKNREGIVYTKVEEPIPRFEKLRSTVSYAAYFLVLFFFYMELEDSSVTLCAIFFALLHIAKIIKVKDSKQVSELIVMIDLLKTEIQSLRRGIQSNGR